MVCVCVYVSARTQMSVFKCALCSTVSMSNLRAFASSMQHVCISVCVYVRSLSSTGQVVWFVQITHLNYKCVLHFSWSYQCKHTRQNEKNKTFVFHPDRCSVLWSDDYTSFWFVYLLKLSFFFLSSAFIYFCISFLLFFFKIHEVELKMISSGGR